MPRGVPPPGGWPAVWTTDADLMFGTVTEAVQALGRRTDLPRPAAAIGIGYPDGSDIRIERALDLTPFGGPGNGGADRLLDCVEHRLMPLLNRRFGLAPAGHALFGHSLGGLLALHALATRTRASSPRMSRRAPRSGSPTARSSPRWSVPARA